MEKHKKIIADLAEKFNQDESVIAFLATGSVARGEASESSDIDLIVIAKETKESPDQYIDGLLVEVKVKTVEDYIQKMTDKPMNVYMWLDAKVIFDKQNVSEIVINRAREIYENFVPSQESIDGTKKWLESALGKIKAAQEKKDDLSQGYNVSNILWIIMQGFYYLNSKPLPPSTTAYRRIKELGNLPQGFESKWEDMLIGNLTARTNATTELINYLTAELRED